MGNGQDRLIGEFLPQNLLDQLIRLRIDMGRGFIDQENFALVSESPGPHRSVGIRPH